MTDPVLTSPSNPAPAADVLSEQRGIRIAAIVTAAPVICCAAGLIVLLWFKHHQAALVAEYASRHMTPWPAPHGWMGEPASFLHVSEPTRDVLVRNPAQWNMNIAMTSFGLAPALLIAAASAIYGVINSNRAALTAPLVPLLALACLSFPPLQMIVMGREIVLDGAHDALTINGHRRAALSDVTMFVGRTARSSKSVSFSLLAVLASGSSVALGGPDDRPDLVGAALPLNEALHRLRGAPK